MSWNLNRALVVAGAFFVLFGLLAASSWDFASVFGPMGVPFLVGVVAAIVLAFYAPAWMYLVAGILVAAFPLVVVFVFGAYNAIIHPGTGIEAVGLLLMLLGALMGLIGGITGFAQRKRTQPPVAGVARAPQGIAALLLAALVLGLVVSAMWSDRDVRDAAESPVSVIEGPDATLQLFASAYQFAPRDVAMNATELTILHIENRDTVVHTFSYEMDGEIHRAILPSKATVEIPFKFDAARSLHFFCEPHAAGPDDTSPDSMWGTLTVA